MYIIPVSLSIFYGNGSFVIDFIIFYQIPKKLNYSKIISDYLNSPCENHITLLSHIRELNKIFNDDCIM